jgi:hypothetical protein
MDNLEFAKAMIRYEELFREMKAIEELIYPHVLALESSQSVGNVTAKYTNGRTYYDYEFIRYDEEFPQEELTPYIKKHTQTIEKVDWRSICKELDYDPPIDKEPVPSVKIVVKE